MGGESHAVLIVNDLPAADITPARLFSVFSFYGNVTRVKIMAQKRDTALVQYMETRSAEAALTSLNGAFWRAGAAAKPFRLNKSSHAFITGRGGSGGASGATGQRMQLTQDFTPGIQRYRLPTSRLPLACPPSRTLHVSHLPEALRSEQPLLDVFAAIAPVQRVQIVHSPSTKGKGSPARCWALVELKDAKDCVYALAMSHNYPHTEKQKGLQVSFTTSTIRE